jgi:hypothetical protein
MTILQKPRQSAAKGWHGFGRADQAVRHTDAWEHENFQEEQARWERSDPQYARICDEVRRASKRGEGASLRADEAKAEWDARVASQRHAIDDAQKAHHALKVDQTARRQAELTGTFVPATEAPSPKERRDATLGDPR